MVSPMELSLLSTPGAASIISTDDALRTFPEMPKGVVDIDAQPDQTAPCIYSKEVVRYWRVRDLPLSCFFVHKAIFYNAKMNPY